MATPVRELADGSQGQSRKEQNCQELTRLMVRKFGNQPDAVYHSPTADLLWVVFDKGSKKIEQISYQKGPPSYFLLRKKTDRDDLLRKKTDHDDSHVDFYGFTGSTAISLA